MTITEEESTDNMRHHHKRYNENDDMKQDEFQAVGLNKLDASNCNQWQCTSCFYWNKINKLLCKICLNPIPSLHRNNNQLVCINQI